MDESVYDIIKVYLAQVHSATKISEIICEHGNREELIGDDIICGLVYRLMTPMSDEEIQDSLNTAEDFLNDSDDCDDCDDCDEEEDNCDELLITHEIPRKIKSNHCNCDICCNVRVCLLNYQGYEPLDILACRFKNSIQETCDKHKIFI